jgi:2-aminoadipate transaminase
MRAALARHFGPEVHSTDPEGGYFLWVTFPSHIDTSALFEAALAAGVAYIPGSAFSTTGGFRNALRLCFATSTPERIDEGIARLATVISPHDPIRPLTGRRGATT